MADRVTQPISPQHARALIAARPAAPGSETAAIENYALGTLATFLIILAFAITTPGCRHWFIMPVLLCGILSAVDIVAWIRGHVDIFDPRALIGIMAFHGTTLSPLMHMYLGDDSYTPYYDSQIDDWGYWFGMMSIFNALGLFVFRIAQGRAFAATKPAKTKWVIDDRRLINILPWAIVIAGTATLFIIVRLGGLKKESDYMSTAGDALVHTSWLLMLGDPLGLLIGMAVVRALSDARRKTSIATIATVLIVMALAQFMILGLRGSRSATLYVMFMIAGMCHYRLGRIRIQWILIGGVLMLAFVYYYAFFKKMGSQGFQALESNEQRLALEARTGISLSGILLGDFSRAEIQAFMLQRVFNYSDRYRYRYGQTYWRSALMLIPRALWPDKPPGCEEAGTNIQYGEGTFVEGRVKSSRVYGLSGEAMLNWGASGIPLMWAVYGLLVGYYRRKLNSLEPTDARLFVTPMFTLALILTVIADSDNLIFGLLKNGTLPTLVMFFSSARVARTQPTPATAKATVPAR